MCVFLRPAPMQSCVAEMDRQPMFGNPGGARVYSWFLSASCQLYSLSDHWCCGQRQLTMVQGNYRLYPTRRGDARIEAMERFLLASLATWRVTHLLACEDGPADVFVRFRARLGSGFFGKLMDCFQCLSFWVALPLAFFVSRELVEWFVIWLALSGTACLLERLVPEPVVIEPIAEGAEGNGMLRSETSAAETGAGAAVGAAAPGQTEDAVDQRGSQVGGGGRGEAE